MSALCYKMFWSMKFLFLFSLLFIAVVSQKRPNVIVIVADDLGWNDLGFHGSPQIPTPHLDSLANSGIILNNYYVCSICTPSRSALMTGLYPIHTGMQHDVIYAPQPYGLDLSLKLLPQHLKKLGYATHMVGKWHLGFFRKEYTPTYRGFDSFYGYWNGKEDYYTHQNAIVHMMGLDLHQNMDPVLDQIGNYSTEIFADRATNIIMKHNTSNPLFLYLPFQSVHSANEYTPLQAPIEYVQRFSHIKDKNRRIFAGMVSAMDDAVGRVIASLKSKDMLKNSIILFTTDNGGPAAGFNDNAASNWPLRGVKYTLWEGGTRGIAFLWSNLLDKVKRTSMQLMHITDWLPTLYSAVGGKLTDLGKIDGHDMWQSLSKNSPSPRKEVLLNIDPIFNFSALRVGNYKVLQGGLYDGKWDGWYGPSGRENDTHQIPSSEILCGPQPANASVDCQLSKSPCLFDVDNDPCEYYNLANSKPEILKSLLERLTEYEKTSVPPRKLPADPRSNPKYWNYQWVNWMDYLDPHNSQV